MSNGAQPVKVYVRDQAYGWLPGAIVFIKDGEACVRIELPANWHSSTVLCQDSGLEETEDFLLANAGSSDHHDDKNCPNAFRVIPLSSYPKGQLPLQNKCGHKSDMVDLPHLHEAAMLYNLKERNTIGKPYTRVRDVIVAMNPFVRIEKLYSLDMQRYYAQKLVWPQAGKLEEEKKEEPLNMADIEVNPHIYEAACLAYRGLILENQDQTILVTGESGSGKTETVKHLLDHLAVLGTLQPSYHYKHSNNINIVNKVMHSSGLLEAFGNAKTRRNANSSRFGKLAQLQFTIESHGELGDQREPSSSSLIGSTCTTYLLEKSRVVAHAVGERSFHIFYQLLAAPEEFKKGLWPFFASSRASDFSYLSNYGEFDIEDSDDSEKWNNTVLSFREFNVLGELLHTIMRAMAIVLQLGNLQFGEAHTHAGERETVVISNDALDALGKMLGIAKAELEIALTSRSLKTNFEELRVPLKPALAKEATDALAKEIYSTAFGFVVRHVNEHMKAVNGEDVCGTINLVDIYGFERLAVNRFEQLCINYANEQLQQKYVADNFRILKEEYDNEGIDIFDFSLVDNSEILNLIDGPSGIFVTLQEECTRPMGNDESFVDKVKSTNKIHPHFINEKLYTKTEFGIRHFAGPVTYNAAKFIERNVDKIPEELFSCVSKASNSLIRTEMERFLKKRAPKSKPDESQRKANVPTTIEKFSVELRDLLIAMEGTRTRYIRCIIPNETMSPGVTNHIITLRQLEYAGLMTAVALARESLPDRLSYTTLLNRFGVLLHKADRKKMLEMDLAAQIAYLLTNLFASTLQGGDAAAMPFACGRTKAYLRAGALEHLERLRFRLFNFKAVAIQKWIRGVQFKRSYHLLRRRVVLLQALFRRCTAKQEGRRFRSAALTLTSWLRRRRQQAKMKNLAEKALAVRNLAALTIQSTWRGKRMSSKYRSILRAVVQIQRKSHINRLQGSEHTPVVDVVALDVYSPPYHKALAQSEIDAIKKRIAQRKAALPKYRRADHDLYNDLEDLLTGICGEGMWVQSGINTESPIDDERGENESLRHKSAGGEELQGKRQQTIAFGFDNLEGTKMKKEIAILKGQLEMANVQHGKELQQLEKLSLTREASHLKEIQRLKVDLESAQQHNEALLSHASESEKARGMLTGAIGTVNTKLKQEKLKRRDAVRMLENQLSKIQSLHQEETAKLQEELRQMQDLNLAAASKLHDLQIAHRQEVEEFEAKKREMSTKTDSLEQKLLHLDTVFRVEKEEICKKMTQAKVTECSILEEKIRQQEENSRAEKQELCIMLRETEEQYREEIRIMQEKVLRAKEAQQKLTLDLDSLRADREKEANAAAFLGPAEAKIATLELELKRKDQAFSEMEEGFSKKLKEWDEKHSDEKKRLQTLVQDSQHRMKLELDQLKADHAKERETMAKELMCYQREEAEKPNWQEKLRLQEVRAKEEEARLKQAVETLENKYREEVRELREELFWTQESERQLKSEISEIEASHAEEMDKLNKDGFKDSTNVNEEIVVLKERLEQQEQAAEEEKEAMCKLFRETHEEETRKHKEEVSRLDEYLRQVKSASSRLQTAHAEELEKMLTQTLDYSAKDAEIADLKAKIQAQESTMREEKERLSVWLKHHLEDVRCLKEEFSLEQESHIMDLLHILAEFEAIEEKRAQDMNTILAELETVKQEQGAGTEAVAAELELKRNVSCLGLPTELPTILEAGEISAADFHELEERLAENSSLRAAHSEEFRDTLYKLQRAIKPQNLKYIIKKMQTKHDSNLQTKVFTEIHRMSVELEELYAAEERTQRLMEEEVRSFIERFSSLTDSSGHEVRQTDHDGGARDDLKQGVLHGRKASRKKGLKSLVTVRDGGNRVSPDPEGASGTRRRHW